MMIVKASKQSVCLSLPLTMLTVDSDICLPFQRLRETIFDVPPYRKQSGIKYRTVFRWLKAKRKHKTLVR